MRFRTPVRHGCILATVAVFTAAIGSVTIARQTENAPRQQATLPDGGDVVTAGREVRVSSEVAGDVAAAGADVTIDSAVRGYVMSAGRNVKLYGRIGNDIWAAGETVELANTVGNNAMIAGETIKVLPTAAIDGNASLAGNTVRSEGRIAHNLRAAGSTVAIGGDIGGTVNAKGDRVTVLPGAVIRGDLLVRSPKPPEISPQAQVLGAVRHETPRSVSRWAAWPMYWIWSFLALFLLGAAAILLAPAWSRDVVDMLRARPAMSIVIGALLTFFIPVLVALFAVTIVGIPLAVVAFALYVALLLLAGALVSFYLGDWLLSRGHRVSTSRWAPLAIGVLIVSLVISLPFIGGLAGVIVVMLGAGAIFLELRRHRGLVPRTT